MGLEIPLPGETGTACNIGEGVLWDSGKTPKYLQMLLTPAAPDQNADWGEPFGMPFVLKQNAGTPCRWNCWVHGILDDYYVTFRLGTTPYKTSFFVGPDNFTVYYQSLNTTTVTDSGTGTGFYGPAPQPNNIDAIIQWGYDIGEEEYLGQDLV